MEQVTRGWKPGEFGSMQSKIRTFKRLDYCHYLFSALVALILFHLSLNSAIPPLSSFTFADKFMIVNYLAISVSTALSAIMLVLRDGENVEAALRLNRWTRWAIPLLWAVHLLAMTVWQFNSEQIIPRFQG